MHSEVKNWSPKCSSGLEDQAHLVVWINMLHANCGMLILAPPQQPEQCDYRICLEAELQPRSPEIQICEIQILSPDLPTGKSSFSEIHPLVLAEASH